MAELVRLAFYPFLPQVRDAVAEAGPDVLALLSAPHYAGVRERAVERVRAALHQDGRIVVAPTDERAALDELLAYAVAKMMLTLIGDRILAKRYATLEARRCADALARDEEAALDAVIEHLAMPVRPDGDGWRMHFADYIQVAPIRDAGWKLIEQPVQAGHLSLDRERMVRLCQETLQARLEEELVAELTKVPADLREPLGPYIDRLGDELEEARKHWNTGDFGPVRRELFPPCIVDIFEQMKEGKMVAHHARFAMASFLGTIGMNAEQSIEFFREIPNFDAEKSRYQLEHITGERSVEKYTPPGCQWMQTNGVCPLAKRDNLCAKIKHPLSYYRARIRFAEEDEKKADELASRVARAKQGKQPVDALSPEDEARVAR